MRQIIQLRTTIQRLAAADTAFGLILLLLITVGLAGCAGHSKAAGAADPQTDKPAADAGGNTGGADKTPPALVVVSTITVEPQTISASVAVTGSLAPLPGAEAKVSPVAAGRLKSVLVSNGQHVEKGQLIAVLEAGPLAGQAEQASAAVAAARASLQETEANYRSTVETNSAGVNAARTNLQAAQIALQKLLAGSRPEEIAHARADVDAATATALNARQNLERERTLFTEGIAAKKDVEAASLSLASADAALHSAREDLLLKQQPNRPQDIAAANVAVQQARDALNAAMMAQSQDQVKAAEVSVAQRQLQAAEGTLNAARAQLDSQRILAPVSGTVVQRGVNPGEYLDTSSAVATIVNLARVRVILQVPSEQVSAVRPGQIVEFTPDSQPNETYNARIDLVGSAVNPNTNTISVEATAANPTGALRDDGFVHGRILTSVHTGALGVPASAVVNVDGKPTVFVVGKDGVAHAHPIREGIRQGNIIEIVSGISAGDQVVTTGAYELTDGTHVKAAGSAMASETASSQ